MVWNWKRANPLLHQLKAERDWHFLAAIYGGRLQIEQINGAATRRLPFVAAVSSDEIRLIPLRRNIVPFCFSPDDLRWYGRPVKYTPGINEMWIHVESVGGWYRLRLWMSQSQMQRWVRVMKSVASATLTTAYRRRRPYIHFGPVTAFPAQQDIYGAWTLAHALTLYLTPLNLVVLDGEFVDRTFGVEKIQNIRAGARLDAPQSDGLVRFDHDDEGIAFSLAPYPTFAEALGEAAKRSLEAPIMAKSKEADD